MLEEPPPPSSPQKNMFCNLNILLPISALALERAVLTPWLQMEATYSWKNADRNIQWIEHRIL
jgi:hypothetical protein